MIFNELLDAIDSEDWDILKNKVIDILKLQFKEINFSDVFRGYPNIPPQPKEKYISISDLKNRFSIKNIMSFIAMDQILSLMPYNLQRKLSSEGWGEYTEKYLEKKISLWKETEIKEDKLISEDSEKKRILLLSPSDRQFSTVIGKWLNWVWKEKAYNGENAPTGDAWFKDVLRIAEALSKEKIYSEIFIDIQLKNKIDTYVSENNHLIIHTIKIPSEMPKIGYTRDQSVTWMKNPIIGNMALEIRRGEEEVISEIYEKLDIPPLIRARWSINQDILVYTKFEGGNFFMLKTDKGTALFTGIGVRGSNWATFEFLSSILPENIKIYGVPLSGYIRNWSETGAVHLDVVFTYLGNLSGSYYALVDPMRIGFYSILEYDRKKRLFKAKHLSKIAKEMEIILDEPPRDSGSKITMANALNLGNGKLVVDAYNKRMNKYLEKEFGVDVIEVEIPQIEAGGGGPRCASRELYL